MEIDDKSVVCIVQISRTGDLIQTILAVSRLKTKRPSLKLALVARSRYAKPLLFLLTPLFDHIFLLDMAKEFSEDQGDPHLKELKSYIHRFVANINEIPFTHCINLTFSQSSAYLTTLITAKYKKGMYRNQQGELCVSDPYAQLVYSVVMRGELNPFNVVDLFLWMLEVDPRSVELHQKKHLPPEGKHALLIHPFASQKKKCWPLHKWRELCLNLLHIYPDLEIFVMGDQSDKLVEAPLFEDLLEDDARRFHSLVGSLSLEELYKQLPQFELFIGHDSMGGHLCALEGVPTVTLSFGPVRSQETAPYLSGGVVVTSTASCYPCLVEGECDHLTCHEGISPPLVTMLVRYALEGKELSYEYLMQDLPFLHLTTVDIAVSQINQGVFKLLSLSGHPSSLSNLFREYYDVLWSYMLQERDVALSWPYLSQRLLPFLEDYLQGLEKLSDLNRFAQEASELILSQLAMPAPHVGANELITHSLKRIQEIDALFQAIKKPYPLLAPVIDFFYVKRANLKGEQLLSLATQSCLNYQESQCAIQILREFLQKTMAKNRPERPLCEHSLRASLAKDN